MWIWGGSPWKSAWIVKYKTAYYSFYLPVALAMIYAGVTDREAFIKAEEILLVMGEYFQAQDDYLDCYGDPSIIGKHGTDILDNKCSWLIVQALKHANPEQRRCLDENYGRKSEACERKVKGVYNELDLETRFKNYEEQCYKDLAVMIGHVDEQIIPKEIFVKLLGKIYKRQK